MSKLACRAIHVLLIFFCASAAQAASLPTGFTETQIASGLASPTAMAFAPDGRLFVCLQGGQVRVIKDGSLLPTPFVSLTVSSTGERGLLGIAFDPSFMTNQFVYLYYTATTPAIHNRVSRFTASGDVALGGSETVILDLDNLSSATNHNGGALHFGLDGKLYVAVGENANGANSQLYTNLLGKMLRINTDGSIPTDNPFLAQTSGRNRAIWALGLRNPFTFAIDPSNGRMLINDVGEQTWEEINEGEPGANYGWPGTEGPTTNPDYDAPIYAYSSASGVFECAITGGTFYRPAQAQFPSEYAGDYFFADYCGGWIRRLDSISGAVSDFAFQIPSPVDLKVGPQGSLYYLARGGGGVIYRIDYTGSQAPNITQHPASQTVPVGQSLTFTVAASGTPPLSYQWQRNGSNIGGATASSYTIASVTAADNGALFRCIVSNQAGTAFSNAATLTVTGNSPPTATITQPAEASLYRAGETIAYAGTATDPQDGTLSPSAFTWQIDFHHETHTHPFMPATTGATSGTFTIPFTGERSADVWYRIYLTVRDSAGLTHTTFRDVRPRTVTITLAASRTGIPLTLDDQQKKSPFTFVGVVGMEHKIGAQAEFRQGSTTYTFVDWSDGGGLIHNIRLPDVATTYTARYQKTRR